MELTSWLRRTVFLAGLNGVLCVIAVLGALLGVIVAASGQPLGWTGGVCGAVAAGWFLSAANRNEKLGLLYRRALRLRLIERFEISGDSRVVQQAWIRSAKSGSGPRDPDDDGVETVLPYWDKEERFMQDLIKLSGSEPSWFESVDLDGVPLLLAGRPIRKVLEPPVFDLED